MKRLRSSGQSAVMTAMLCGMLIVAIAMATNAGKLVTEKIAMQNAVDLAVFSGAATQAGYLNEMRDINDKMWKKVNDTRKIYERSPMVYNMPGVVAPPCGLAFDLRFYEGTYSCGVCAAKSQMPNGLRGNGVGYGAELELQFLKLELQFMSLELEQKNMQGRSRARDAAERAADLNYKGTGGKLQIYKNGANMMRLMDTEKAKVDVTYKGWCAEYCPPAPLPICYPATFEYKKESSNGYQLPGWKFRDGGQDVTFVAGIEDAAPASPYLDIGGYFKSTRCGLGKSPRGGRCPLDVYAAAAPYWGKLGSMDSFDRTNKADWDDNNIMQADRASLLDRHKPVSGNRYSSGTYRDYRARYIGIFESGYNMPGIPHKNRMKH